MTTTDLDSIYQAIQSGTPGAFEHVLSPDDADVLLELNVRNRKPRSSSSQQYASDMKAGRWKYAAEPLKFGRDGNLLDGQHRLLGLASLKETNPDVRVLFLIATGIDNDAQMVMDQGVRRSAGDNLGLKGVANGTDVAAAARAYILWSSGRMFLDKKSAEAKVSNIEAQEWVLEHPEFSETCREALVFKKSIDMAPRLFVAAYAMFKEIDEQMANDFLTQWATGEHLHLGHPVHTLRERLARIRRERQAAVERDFLAFTVLAWNAFVSGHSLARFQRPHGGSWVKASFPKIARPPQTGVMQTAA